VAFFQPQGAYCPGLGLQVPEVGGAARIDDPDGTIALDTFNMRMSTYYDVRVTATVFIEALSSQTADFPEDRAGLEELLERHP
jgi:hypothetical protein